MRLIKGKAEKSKLFEDLCRGSYSNSVCWIEYGHNINSLLPAHIDQYRLDRTEASRNDNEILFYELKSNFEELYEGLGFRYSDIYLYGNFSVNEIDTLKAFSEWLNESDINGIFVRLNCTIQDNNEDLIIMKR